MTAAPKPATRVAARLSALLLGILTWGTGMLPPRIRYGYVHRITRVLLRKPLPAACALERGTRAEVVAQVTPIGNLRCVLAAGALDTGGIGSVVEVLATGLPALGVTPTVVCFDDGVRAQGIRDLGIDVRSVRDLPSALRAFDELGPDVIQLHGAPACVEEAAEASGAPLVLVMHNTEIHFSRGRWRRLSHVLDRSSSAVAVSELVRAFHAAHLPPSLHSRIAVIPNAAPYWAAPDTHGHQAARDHLERAVGGSFNEDVIFVCLARYDAQKNIAGTVASFLACVAAGVPAQIVIAGEPSDWVEFRRADAIRRSSRHADRIHLLASSDAHTLLAAADAFLLNSFFEGWPVAATEAWTAGLPLVLSDVGGARELVERDLARSVLIANAAGVATEVTDARVERARRRARRQSNSSELGDAIRGVVRSVQRERVSAREPHHAADGVAAMLVEHARVLRDAARSRTSDGSARPDRFSTDELKGTVTT